MTDAELKAAAELIETFDRDYLYPDIRVVCDLVTRLADERESERVERAKPIDSVEAFLIGKVTESPWCRVCSWKDGKLHIRCDVRAETKGQLLDLLRALKGGAE